MRTLASLLFLGFLSFSAVLPAKGYKFTVDLNAIKDDKVRIQLEIESWEEPTALYQIPKIVPGTYSIYDFGRFVSGFKAFDKNGKPLKVERKDVNSWLIRGARELRKLEYLVEDTWDAEDVEGESVFEPGGSNIEAGKNFVFNNHCFFGFFENRLREPYEITFLKPEGFYGSTSLIPAETSPTKDVFRTPDYFELADAPMMYCKPDTATMDVGGAQILFSVYSPNDYVESDFIRKEVGEILDAQRKYLGGKLPIEKYAFIIYLFPGFGGSGAFGALEHNYSSFYFLPETFPFFIAQTIRDVSAHEFFHIITPLSIHSEEIHNFDFMDPKMSRHLWLYEGVTEYSANHVQIYEGLIEEDEFLDVVAQKIEGASRFNDTVPFTNMSRGCLGTYKDEYLNVYEKGALIGMCLDIILRRESSGEYGLKDLMEDLSKEYGKEKPFRDEALFGKIEAMTYPAVGTFLRKYVGGPEPLPLQELLQDVGIAYDPVQSQIGFTLGGVDFGVDSRKRLTVVDVYEMDEFGEKVGYESGDVMLKFNGKKIRESNAEELIDAYFEDVEIGKPFEWLIKRKTGKRWKKMTLSTTLSPIVRQTEHALDWMENPSEDQLELRRAWLGQ